MKPMSAMYYIRANRSRSLVMILLMFLSVTVFFIGNFIHSDERSFDKSSEYHEKMIRISQMSIDEDGKDFDTFVGNLKEVFSNIKFIPRGRYVGNLTRKSLMGLELATEPFVFNNASDMKEAFDVLGIEMDFTNIKDRSMVLSKNLADNLGLKLGDKVNSETVKGSKLQTEFTLDGIIDDGAYQVFYICDNGNPYEYYVYDVKDTISTRDFHKVVSASKYKLKVYVSEFESDSVKRNFEPINFLFYTIAFLVAVVLAIVANTVITGFFMKRKYEFGVLRAIGISKNRIKLKVAAEFVIIDLIGMAVGFIVGFVIVYLLNSFCFIPAGKYMIYYSNVGLVGFLLCNMLIMIPMIILKGNQMAKADVTEF